MRKLIGQRSPVTPDFPRSKTPLNDPSPGPPEPSSSATHPRQKPISLATLMGSQETGPRMSKQAPQQNIHDPTQFEQGSIGPPHLVFRKSGVSMPGMVPKSPGLQSHASFRRAEVEVSSPSASPLNLRDRKISTPTIARRYVEKTESEGSSKPSPPLSLYGTRERPRERTMSTPSGLGPGPQRSTGLYKPSPSGVGPTSVNKQSSPFSKAHGSLSTPSTPDPRRYPLTSRPLSSQAKPELSRKIPQPTPQSRRIEAESSSRSKSPTLAPNFRESPSPSKTSTPPLLSATVITTPTLPRPVEQRLNSPLQGPKVVSYNASPAFSDRTPPKGVTPSLSRLQGRGFVQNMIKASAKLESSAGVHTFPPSERSRSEPRKKASLLDHWTGAGSAVSTPVVSPTPVSMRKAKTLDLPNIAAPGPLGRSQPSPSPMSVSMPKQKSQTFEGGANSTPPLSKSPSKGILVTSKEKEEPASTIPATPSGQLPGVGSSNTLVSYIKPMKTGDSEPPSPVRSRIFTADDAADELGIRKRKSSGKLREKSVSFAASPPRPKEKLAMDVLPSPNKPLRHVRPLRC